MYKVIIVVKQDITGAKLGKPDVSLCAEIDWSEDVRRLVNGALSTAGVPSREDKE